eukprot:gene67201-92057_t
MHHRDLDRAHLEDLGAERGHLQHLLEGDPVATRPHALEARRDHPGVVHHQHVARAQEARQVTHLEVAERLARRHEQQARRIARTRRPKRDPIVREGEVKHMREPPRQGRGCVSLFRKVISALWSGAALVSAGCAILAHGGRVSGLLDVLAHMAPVYLVASVLVAAGAVFFASKPRGLRLSLGLTGILASSPLQAAGAVPLA